VGNVTCKIKTLTTALATEPDTINMTLPCLPSMHCHCLYDCYF